MIHHNVNLTRDLHTETRENKQIIEKKKHCISENSSRRCAKYLHNLHCVKVYPFCEVNKIGHVLEAIVSNEEFSDIQCFFFQLSVCSIVQCLSFKANHPSHDCTVPEPICAIKNCDLSVCDQSLILQTDLFNRWSHDTAWQQSGQYILQLPVFSLSILHIFT